MAMLKLSSSDLDSSSSLGLYRLKLKYKVKLKLKLKLSGLGILHSKLRVTPTLSPGSTSATGCPSHRFHSVQAKASERTSASLSKIRKHTDWAENGEIIVKEQMQSEYWHTKYYSLLM